MNIKPVPGSISSPEKEHTLRSGTISPHIQLTGFSAGVSEHQDVTDSNRSDDITSDDAADISGVRGIVDAYLDLSRFSGHSCSTDYLDHFSGPAVEFYSHVESSFFRLESHSLILLI
jgi:hypothetical protein